MKDNLANINKGYFHFENPEYLWFLAALIIFIGCEFLLGRRFAFSLKKLRKFIDEHLLKHLLLENDNQKRNKLKIVFMLLLWCLLIFALANPRWNFTEVESFKPNVNIVFLVDLSKSMDAEDEKPSRIERVKQEIRDIISNVTGVNTGVIAFASQAHIISPVTNDRSSVEYLIDSLDTELISVQGSNIAAALKSAHLLLKPLSGGINYIVIMSDGDFEKNVDLSVARDFKEVEIITYAFGSKEGAPIPLKEGGFLKYGGKMILSKLEEQNLLKLSGESNKYIKASYLDDDLKRLQNIIESGKATEKKKFSSMRIWEDNFYIFLIAALIIILPFFRKGAVFPVIVLLFSSNSYAQEEQNLDFLKKENIIEKLTNGDFFRNQDQRALRYYDEKQFDDAAKNFNSDYNKGISYYRSEDYQKAEELFRKSDSIESTYNLGNALLKQLKAKEAIKAYESVLKRNRMHEEAAHNLEIAKRLLQKQQQNQTSQQNNKNHDNKQQDQDKNQGQDNDSQNNDAQNDEQKNKDNKRQNQQNNKDQDQNGRPEEQRDSSNQKKNQASSNPQNRKNNQDQEGEQQTGGNEERNKLDIEAEKLFKKISGDPKELMKNRFRFEEGSQGKLSPSEAPRPW
jgi:Ca-activated chloride channel family protein